MGTAINVKQLSKDERLDLIEQLWESLSDEERDSLPLAADQEVELNRRLDAVDREGPVGISPDELRKQIRGRSSRSDWSIDPRPQPTFVRLSIGTRDSARD
jgi:putative addiction module component (TIGR02574 family)